ncbi:MAG TPA: DUF2520 domain-containing protein [Candidatus Limnocylindrales bacterium]|nr:DUF2520 domain-containing protein [Candidatus Limnocylindrales bacterium]
MARSISILGAGRLGKTFAKCLRRCGWRIGAVVARSEAHARAAVRWIGAGTPAAMATPNLFLSDVVLVSVPDSAIREAAERLARAAGSHCRGKIVLHTSGALDRSVLAPLAKRGAATGSIHPMQTFTGRTIPKLEGIIFALEGDAAALRAARRIVRDMGGIPVRISSRAKAAYHAAGAIVAGEGLAIMETAVRILTRTGFTRRRALQAVLPLMRQMLDNFGRVGPRASWTGPIARGDYSIVAAHARALRTHPREFRQAYAALALLSGRVLAGNPKAAIRSLRRALGTIERRLF